MWATCSEVFKVFLMLFAMASCSGFANSQTPTPQANNSTVDSQSVSEVLTKLDQLVEQNRQLEKHNRELMDEIVAYRQVLAKQVGPGSGVADQVKEGTAPQGSPTVDESHIEPAANSVSSEQEPYKWGGYTPNLGYKIANKSKSSQTAINSRTRKFVSRTALSSSHPTCSVRVFRSPR